MLMVGPGVETDLVMEKSSAGGSFQMESWKDDGRAYGLKKQRQEVNLVGLAVMSVDYVFCPIPGS